MLRDLGEIPLFFKIGEEPEKIKKTLNLIRNKNSKLE
jgi:hypothetical protein